MTVLDKFSLKGKTAIVTGSAGIIGKMIHETIFELGGKVIDVDIRGNNPMDIRCLDSIRQLTGTKCDILVNNAVGGQQPTAHFANGWEDDIEIGLTGAVNIIQLLLPELRKRNGVILNIGSDLSLIGPDQSLYPGELVKPLSYSVVKHGIVGLTRYFAATYPEIRCNCLCPGGIDVGQKQPRTALNRLARLDELVGPVAFLISKASSYMTGAVLVVDGGRTCI